MMFGFKGFPTPSEFSDKVLVTEDQAKELLRYIENGISATQTAYDAAWMAAVAINNGLDYDRALDVCTFFESDRD